ncbi:hypothetical protein GQ457_15G017260 [Hibiscus cannabinus]
MIEASQLQFQEETKVIHKSLIGFLYFQFPSTTTFFTSQPEATPPAHFSAATQPISSANPSAKAGNTEEVHFSSDDENDIFDWQSPRDHLHPINLTPWRAAAPDNSTAKQSRNKEPAEVPILSPAPTPAKSAVADHSTPDSPARRKGKAPTGRTVSRHAPSSPKEEEQTHRSAKKHRKYHIITADSDYDNSAAVPVAQPEKSIQTQRDLAKVQKIMIYAKLDQPRQIKEATNSSRKKLC